jgi:cellulose synthase/poly-beta-1,6-N-acetylglucosamine synthase-like glycosyltransferase
MATRGAPPIVDRRIQPQVARYAEWLAAQSQRSVRGDGGPGRSGSDAAREMNAYIELAGQMVQVGKKQVATFAPFRPDLSALRTFTPRQVFALLLLSAAWVIGLIFARQGLLIATIALITLVYVAHLGLHIFLAFATFGHSNEEEIDERVIAALGYADWPPYTILCPLYKEAQVVPQFAQAMSRLSYPVDKLQILLLTEQDDRETRDAIRALNLPAHFKIVTVPDGKPRTKPRACNYGLMQATGQFVVIYDAEDVPDRLQLKKAVLTFANHDASLACVQARLNYYNSEQNLLTRWFTAEYSLWFDLILPGLQRAGFSMPLGGTSNHFRIQTLRALGAWDAYNVTEDCDLGLRLARYGFDTVVLNSVTFEEANSQLKNWIRQRSRWIKGYMQTYLVYMRHPWRYLRPSNFREFLSLQLVIGSKAGILFLNPLLWLSFVLYLLFPAQLGHTFHMLYPKPLLYLNALSLIFGNFLYLYSYLLACMRHKQYRLVKWAIFIPFYWMLMSVAAFMALFQLIVKPHYWEKTIHGLHLRKNKLADLAMLDAAVQQVTEEQTIRMPSAQANGHYSPNGRNDPYASYEKDQAGFVSTVTTALRSLMTLPMPAISPAERARPQAPVRWKDPWVFAVVFLALNASIVATRYSYDHGYILLYNDAYAHLRIPLRVISDHFSIAQFGGVWLPLPHILMLPFIWNTFLMRTGLAGTIPSMFCYIVASAFLFMSARRLTRDNLASLIGTLVFVLNPNILYLQTTPLSEPVCIATLTIAGYFFLAWTQEDHPRYLVLTAAGVFLATLARYDGWMLCVLLPPLILVIGRIKHHSRSQITANILVFSVFAGLGIMLWMAWCYLIFGDPLYFQHSQFSSQAQQVLFILAGTQYTYHDLIQSFRYYILNSIDVVGPLLFVIAALAMFSLISRRGRGRTRAPEVIGALAFLAPLLFYVVSLYTGQATLYVPEAVPPYAPQNLFNARFGAEMVVPAALFICALVTRLRIPALGRIWGFTGQVAFILVILAQTVLLATNGIITLQDGQYGVSCAEQHPINIYLAEHYNGGKILEDIYSGNIDGIDVGLDYLDFVSESSGKQWVDDLRNPANVDWIIVRPEWLRRPGDQHDLVAQHIDLNSLSFLSEFSLMVQEPTGLELYHRNGLPPLPTRPVSPELLNEHKLCSAGT